MNDDRNDHDLLRGGLIAGNEADARLLYRRHTPTLHRLAMHLADRPEDADDFVHDTWLRASAGAARFAGRSSVRTWLTGILLNRARESRREARRADLVALTDEVAAPEPEPPARADRIDLERAIATLPPGYRQVLLLHDVEGHTHEEIGTMLGVDPGTSKSQLSRARRAVIRALGPDQRRHHG